MEPLGAKLLTWAKAKTPNAMVKTATDFILNLFLVRRLLQIRLEHLLSVEERLMPFENSTLAYIPLDNVGIG